MAQTMMDGYETGIHFNHNSEQRDWMTDEHKMGTTIMAVEFDGGVVMGADSRTTTGSYIANRVSDKIQQVHDRIFCCRSGSAADTQALAYIVRDACRQYDVQNNEPPTVKTAAVTFRNLNYRYKEQLMASIICAGWDRRAGGSVYVMPLGATLLRQPFAVGGSGSTYIYGYCDANFKEKMSQEECENFVKNGLALAMARDGSSGGIIRLAIITKDGVVRKYLPNDKLPKFYEG